MISRERPAGATPDDDAATAPSLGVGYFLAFLVYGAIYAVVFLASGQVAWSMALVAGVANVLPQALLGLLVVSRARRTRLPERATLSFVAREAALACAFAMLATAGTTLLFALRRSVEAGRWVLATDPQVLAWQLFQAALVYVILASVASGIATLARLRAEEARAAQAAELRVRAELKALEAQLNPHFLFNTLHTLLALVRRSPQAAEEAIEQFGELLRHVLRSGRSRHPAEPLTEEWAFVENYLALEKLRLGDRLGVRAEATSEALACALPPFTLQPLVENAVRHGLAPRAAGGTLILRASVADGTLLVEVRDDGAGADPRALAGTTGLGLRLVRERLKALHGAAACLDIATAPGQGFAASVRLPATSVAAAGPGPAVPPVTPVTPA